MKQLKFLSIVASSMFLLAACGEKEAKPASTENIEEASNDTTNTTKDTNSSASTDDSSTEVTSTDDTSTVDSSTEKDESDTTEVEKNDTTSTSDSNESTLNSTEDSSSKDKNVETTTSDKKATTNSSANSSSNNTKVNLVHKDFLQNQLKTAKNGMTEGVPFESGQTVLEDVISEWGEPDTKYSNDTNYIEYKKNGTVQYALAVGRGDRIYDVRTFVAPDNSFQLSDMTFDEIISVLGTPNKITTTGSDKVLNYNTGKNTLKFVGPSSTNKLNHISIFNQSASEPMGGKN